MDCGELQPANPFLPKLMPLQTTLRAIFFDTFGTVVEWRTCVSQSLRTAAQDALYDSNRDVPTKVRNRVSAYKAHDWNTLTEEWRRSYMNFTGTFDSASEFVSVDCHHHTALQELLRARKILGLFNDSELWELTLCWHRLDPWPDSVPGLELLNRRFITSTLSNGNISLLQDLKQHGMLPFAHVVSAEDFGAYKPSPKVYNGAAQLLGRHPSECALVAAHLKDLQAAKRCGYQTIYVERDLEESWSADQIMQAKVDGFVDIWIEKNCGGILEVARRLGVKTTH